MARKKKKKISGGGARSAELRSRIFKLRSRRNDTVPAKDAVAVIDDILAAFGDEAEAPGAVARAKHKDGATKKPIADADLLNGPQLKAAAKTQEEIDALLFGPGR